MTTSKPADPAEPANLSIASAPCDLSAVPGLLGDIASLGNNHDFSADREARLSLIEKARSLVSALETPREAMSRHIGAETASFFSIGLGVEAGLFRELATNNGAAKTAPELAKALGFDINALRPILRHLTAMKHIVQTNPDEYAPNNFSLFLSDPVLSAGYPLYRDVCIPPMLHLHKWLATKSYAAPSSIIDNPFTFGHQTSSSLFEFLASHPVHNTRFNHHMRSRRLGRPSWFHPSIYPVTERLLTGCGPLSSNQFVDVGGNLGKDLLEFSRAFPQLRGSLVLQDQAAMIGAAPGGELEAAGVETMVHDFFAPQPVEGARAYYLHSILHDWPDEQSAEIVGQIKKAMKPGYSRLLVNEHVIPSLGVSWEVSYLDIYMMILCGARERTEEDWVALLEGKCGLRVLKVWNPGNGVEGIIECEVPLAN
ncbi:S-adenosyl-L-methionine-dependent methyltransferase [Immersiella caudata]|uniref:S-adenosyl-L-methionine-dependent methyltransferase n=1 Tax=Immersiella caudata TaxID=314043 RepID=A0AA40C7A1_9PEZI|nr:S-adenosyl-L-methionine-dependent methyltransferase [Immersiella caudata]